MSLTPEESEAERKRFEAWWLPNVLGFVVEPTYIANRGYLLLNIQRAWEAWLAGVASERERVRQELPRLIQQYGKVRQEYGRFDAGDDGAAILEKISAILGVK